MALDSYEQYWLGEDRKTTVSRTDRPEVAVLNTTFYGRIHRNDCSALRFKREEMRRNSKCWHGPFARLSAALNKGQELYESVVKCAECIGDDN